MTISHWVDFDAPGKRLARAICGQVIDRQREVSIRPDCQECARLLYVRAQDDALTADDVFGSEAPGAPVHSTLSDPLAGYRPKGVRS